MALELGTDLRCRFIDGYLCWCIRDFGRLLGYGADGGNLSRNVRGKWFQKLEAGEHYHERPLEKGSRQRAALWATPSGITKILEMVMKEEPPQYQAAVRVFRRLRYGARNEESNRVVKTQKSSKKFPKGSHVYVVQKGKAKGKRYVITPKDPVLLAFKRKSYLNMKEIDPKKLNPYQRVVRELVMDNRRIAAKSGTAAIRDHLAYAARRKGYNGKPVAEAVPKDRIE